MCAISTKMEPGFAGQGIRPLLKKLGDNVLGKLGRLNIGCSQMGLQEVIISPHTYYVRSLRDGPRLCESQNCNPSPTISGNKTRFAKFLPLEISRYAI